MQMSQQQLNQASSQLQDMAVTASAELKVQHKAGSAHFAPDHNHSWMQGSYVQLHIKSFVWSEVRETYLALLAIPHQSQVQTRLHRSQKQSPHSACSPGQTLILQADTIQAVKAKAPSRALTSMHIGT